MRRLAATSSVGSSGGSGGSEEDVPSVYDRCFEVPLQEEIDMVFQCEDEEIASVEQEESVVLDPLYEGSKISKDESTSLIYGYSLRHKLSKIALSELLGLINSHVLKGASVPASLYKLEKQLEPDFSQVIKSIFCKTCESQVETSDNECKKCNTVVNGTELLRLGKFYLQFDIHHVLKTLLEIPEVANNLVNNLRTRVDANCTGIVGDIVDGQCYKKLKLKSHDITVTMNTDGVSVFKSSKFSAWPIFVSINELDYKLRRKHTKLVALWLGKKKPEFNTFLTPFVDQCNLLSEKPLTWSHNGIDISSNIHVLMVAADSVARCALQGVKQFNGYFSCHYCYIKGEKYELEGGGHKMVFPPSTNDERTDESFFEDIKSLQVLLNTQKAQKTNQVLHVNGVQSVSPLVGLNNFDMVSGFPVDYMHTAILGVLKTLTLMLFDSKNKDESYYLKKDAQANIVQRFIRCKVPYEVNRSTRDLDEMASWKANEWKTWLLVCIPILKGVLLDTYVNHLTQFVAAMTLLLRDRVTEEDIEKADQLINHFIVEAGDLYGKKVYTFNMHLLTHFPQCVRNWGPVWGYSLFQFEDANGRMTKNICGTREVGMQIAKKVCIKEKVLATSSSCMKNPEAAALLTSMLENKTYYKNAVKCYNVTFVGPRKRYYFNDDDNRLLSGMKIDIDGIDTVWSYKHVLVKNKKFCTVKGDSARFCNSFALILSKYYSINEILLINYKSGKREPVVFCSQMQVEVCPGFEHSKTLLKLKGRIEATSIFPLRFIEKCKFITLYDDHEKVTLLSKLPNCVELE
jgi:hypothetical protein